MTLRKITTDNSVKYIPKGEKTREPKQNSIKNKSNLQNKTKLFHKTIKNSLILWQDKDLD